LAIFDIDGTIFRSSLLIELTDHLVSQGIFPKEAYSEIAKKEQRWLDRQGSYGDYIRQVVVSYAGYLRGVSKEKVQRMSAQVIHEQYNRVYVYTRELISELRKTHRLVAISGSPEEIVKEFQKAWRFHDAFGTEYETKKGLFTGKELSVPSKDKQTFVRRLVEERGFSLLHSVGVGDTEADIGFLRIVSRPIAFNPNRKLLQFAHAKGWEIRVERKDVIYTL